MASFEPVRAILRGLQILRVISENGPIATMDIAKQVKLPQPTVVRILETLVAAGYVYRLERTTLFGVTARTLTLSKGFAATSRLVQLATPLIEALRTAVTQRPDDPEGLALLAEHEGRLGNLAAARDAQARLIAVKGAGADALDHARLAGIMIEAAGGTVSKEAAAELERALERDPRNGQALYLKGLMLAQNDRPDLAFPIWRDLAERGPHSDLVTRLRED